MVIMAHMEKMMSWIVEEEKRGECEILRLVLRRERSLRHGTR